MHYMALLQGSEVLYFVSRLVLPSPLPRPDGSKSLSPYAGICVSRLSSAGVQAESQRADRFRLSYGRNFEPKGFTELEASQVNCFLKQGRDLCRIVCDIKSLFCMFLTVVHCSNRSAQQRFAIHLALSLWSRCP